eukprot:TRINITY_DN1777_c1_g1_i2.p1 TRINITY_DN1777_c1_g1~~TRINITY_DN1777_c1_g1_i2.p1  ORF type:complete len:792 (+),score=162.34 TRINITY_DN1777_c1_g1_i2:402-2777(+)
MEACCRQRKTMTIRQSQLFDETFEYQLYSPHHDSCNKRLKGYFVSMKIAVQAVANLVEPDRIIDIPHLNSYLPHLVFATASSGKTNVYIEKEDIGAFLIANRKKFFIVPNVHIVFPIVNAYLEQQGEDRAVEVWKHAVDKCRLRDPLILDTLVRLGINDELPEERLLQEIVEEYLEYPISDYGFDTSFEIGTILIAPTVSNLYSFGNYKLEDELYVEYHMKECIAILLAYVKMYDIASELMESMDNEIYGEAILEFGPLSEGIQVKGKIALSYISMFGMQIDLKKMKAVKKRLKKRIAKSAENIVANPEYEGLFKLTVNKGVIIPKQSKTTYKPSINRDKLTEILMKIIDEVEAKYGIEIILPYNRNGERMTFSRKVWSEYKEYHPFISNWIELENAGHFLSYLKHLTGNVVHPIYKSTLRNGRTSCSKPAIQQTPRKGGFREIFIPKPGNIYVSIDYSYIELCTLAAVCEHKYGNSVLASTIRDGYDPHCFTAAMLKKMPFDEFMALKDDPETKQEFSSLRQKAKAINFGIPSGLSVPGLSEYATSSYGIEMSIEEAEEFRTLLITQIYPELSLYLEDVEMKTLAKNMGCSEKSCWRLFSYKEKHPGVTGGIRNIVRGKTVKRDGTEYSKNFVNKVWRGIDILNKNEEVSKQLSESEKTGSEELFKNLMGKKVATLTGRIRGKVAFTQACNTAFSGLAADGAKIAMWDLFAKGYEVVAFIHDEMIIEIPEESDWDAEVENINSIVCGAMQSLTPTVPIKASYGLSMCWSKNVEAVYDENGKLKLWENSYY